MGSNFNRALTLVLQTTPYLLYRAAVYALLLLAVVAYLGVIGLVGWVFGPGAFWALFLAAGLAAALLGVGRMLDDALDYLVRAGHVALLAQAASRGRVPMGAAQLRWARNRVTARFDSIHALSKGRRMIRQCITDLNSACFDVQGALPIQGLEGSTHVAGQMVNASLSYLVNGALGLIFLAPSKRVHRTMRAALVQYCQAWKPLLTLAICLRLASVAFVVIAALAFMAPLGAIALAWYAESASVRFALFLLAIGMGILLKGIIFDPVAEAVMVLTLLEQAEVQESDPEWAAKAAEMSQQCRELAEKAEAEAAANGGH